MPEINYGVFHELDAEKANQMPSYQYAADNHSIGNGNFAVTDPSTWSTGVDNAGKFVATATLSGLNSFYNSAVTVGNWLGADMQENDTATWIASMDDDLGKYYSENKEGADLAGFVLTSLIPGMAGVKLLNAGQKALRTAQSTGMIGGNMSRVTGLLTPSTKAHATLAAAEIAQSSATFSAINSTAIRAIGAGYGQAALESAAFEIAVVATMFKSPVLDNQDAGDIAKNVLLGTAVGGVIGGAINHAITYQGIKNAVKRFNPAEKQFADTADLTSLNPAQRIIARNDVIATMPDVPTTEAIVTGGFPWAEKLLDGLTDAQKGGVAEKLVTRLSRLKEETLTSMANKNRMDFHELTTKDKDLANHLADLSTKLSPEQMFANMEGLVEFGRVGSVLKSEAKIAKEIKEQPLSLDDIRPLTRQVGYVKLNGEGMGNFSFDTPKVLSLGDQFKNKDEILNHVKSYGFKEKNIWDARNAGSHTEAEARYIWADNAKVENGMTIGEYDIPLLERALVAKLDSITVASDAGHYVINNFDDLAKHIQVSKQEAAMHLLKGKTAGTGMVTEEIAKITNVRLSYLEGEVSSNVADDLFARQGFKSQYIKQMEAKGLKPNADDLPFHPTYVKAAYDTEVLTTMDAFEVSGMAYLKAQQKAYQQGIDNALAEHLPEELMTRLWHPGDDVMLKTNRFGAGPGLVSFANGGYHTPESWAEAIGSATQGIQKHFKEQTSEALNTSLYRLVANQEAAIEFSSINKMLQSTSEHYGINEAGTALVPLKLLDYQAAVAAGKKVAMPALQEGAPLEIKFQNVEAAEAWIKRTELTSKRTSAFGSIRNAQGLEDLKDPRAVRPIRPDPKDYPYYAVVVDPTITGVGHKSMIHANSPKELEAMINKVPGKFEVYKGDQLKEFHKAHGEFDYELTLHENYIDGELKRSGVNNPFFVQTDPQKITQSILQDHLRSDDIFARELVNAKYEKEFGFLRQQGAQYTNTATSKYTGSYREIENTVKNPYTNYVKTALNISQMAEHPYLMGINQKLDAGVSKIWNTISDTVSRIKTPEQLDELNKHLNKYGLKSAYYDAATDLLANHVAPKGVLMNFVQRANAMLATLTLRLDPLNAINNAVGSTVLYGTELKSFIRSMGNEDTELAGKLSGLLKMDRPGEAALRGEATDKVTTAGKIMQQAVKNWFDKDAMTLSGVPLKDYYKANGWSTRLVDQHTQMMEDLTLIGTERAEVINGKLRSAFEKFRVLADKGEKLTGNKYAEEFNRFVSADSMRQLTDLGVQHGKITEQEAIAYINTFVNRTQGNITASQRPLMFQGAIGQAVGLFQTYQFNMIQQLFRHVTEGGKKDAAMLLGLQGTMYGMNGLPGFNFLNTHIVGTMSGNPEHTDMYSTMYGIAGKQVGDLLLYGLPSNLLRANLYSRGDINPRHVTIVPTNPVDIPFVNATIKMYDNVANMTGRMSNGASMWQSLLQGIEHNGLSRPLAGLAQTMQAMDNGGKVFSTTNKGSISGGNDLFSWATATRLAGGKPFDDAVANDAVFRSNVYKAADRAKMQKLSLAVKTSGIAGGELEPEQIQQFAARYAAIGGKQENFNKFMINQIKSANTNKANDIMYNLRHPYSQKMQQIMGGTAGLDGSADFSGSEEQ